MFFHDRKDEVVGLEWILKEESNQVNFVALKSNGSELELLDFQSNVSLSDTKKLHYHPKVTLVVTGSGIVDIKEENESSGLEPTSGKVYRQKNDDASITLIRKDKLDGILRTLEEYNIFPNRIYLGSQLKDEYHELIHLKDLHNINFGEGTYDVKYHNALAGALTNFLEPSVSSVEVDSTILAKHENIQYRSRLIRSIQYSSILFGLVLLIGLTVNVLISRNETKMQVKNRLDRPNLIELQKLNAEIELKKSLLSQNNWAQSSKISFNLDQVASSIPKEIKLSNWSCFEESTNEFVIKGWAEKSSDFNGWIESLKELKIIKKTSISFDYDEMTAFNDKGGLFTLTFKIQDDG